MQRAWKQVQEFFLVVLTCKEFQSSYGWEIRIQREKVFFTKSEREGVLELWMTWYILHFAYYLFIFKLKKETDILHKFFNDTVIFMISNTWVSFA
jgi:hypothetical protein